MFFLFFYILGGLECAGHSIAYVANVVHLIVVWIRTQRAMVASRRATNLATHLPEFNHPSPYWAIHLPML